MASPSTDTLDEVDADDAIETFLDGIVISSSQQTNECESIPPSPELGMGPRREIEVHHLELEGPEEQTTADAEPFEAAHSEQQTEDFTPVSDSKEATRLLRSYQIQQSSPQGVQKATASSEDARIMTPAPTCPLVRRSARVKSTLVYDQKYHPLDDAIRPSQAAKRRTLHGEQPLLWSGLDGETSEGSASDVGSMIGDEDRDAEEPQRTRNRKRKRARSLTLEPTRRSSRRRSKPKTSYNMNIHPQDSDLKRVWACDGSKSSPSPTKQTAPSTAIALTRKTSSEEFEDVCRTLLDDGSEGSLSGPAREVPESPCRLSPTTELIAQHEDKLAGTRQALLPEFGHPSADRDAWPAVNGLPFHIFTERIEDQLGAEAEAASPFHYEHDDKENVVTNPELIPRPNTLDGISIIPASHYRRPPELYTISGHSSMASNAFYVQPQFEAGPYGLGWSDGAHDTYKSGHNNCLAPEYHVVRIMASSEHPSRTLTPSADPRLHGDNDSNSASAVRSLEGLDCLR